MFTIGEFARLGQISVRMLRHYDELGLLTPARTDPVTSYRGYSIAQLRDLNRIVALRGLGFSLSEVRGLLGGGISAAELRGMLVLRQAELERQLEADRSTLARVEARLRAIETEDDMPDGIVIKHAPEQRLLALARPIPGFGPDNIGPVLEPAYDELKRLVAEIGLEPVRTYVACYEVEAVGEDQREVTMFFGTPVPQEIDTAPHPAEFAVLPGVDVATCVRQGSVPEVWPRIVNDTLGWIEQHGYEHVGPGRDYFLEINEQDVTKHVFEIQVPIRRPGEPIPAVAPRRLGVRTRQ